MADVDLKALAAAWIDEHKGYRKTPQLTAGWGYKTLNNLVDSDPNVALAAIEYICGVDDSDAVMEILAAGPLENLLSRHGPLIIDHVEAIASANPRFRELLGGVWSSTIASEVWNRIEKIRSDRW